jgi:hypothetical protein
MCDDCQTFAHFLGRADEILDEHGGTEIYQLPPARLSISKGADQIRCMRLSPKGLMRWYTGCCNTPIGNTLSAPRFPFVGVPTLFFTSKQDLGPIRAKLMGKYARGQMPADAHPTRPLILILRTIDWLLLAFLRGLHTPTPFFDARRQPVVEPLVISQQERQRLRQQAKL